MKRRGLIFWILLPWMLLMLAGSLIFRTVSIRNFESFVDARTELNLKNHAAYLERLLVQVQPPFLDADETALLTEYRTAMGIRITLVTADGRVFYDSHEDAKNMDFHGDRPEIVDAVRSGEGQSNIRYSYTLGKELMYLALPVKRDGRMAFLIRVSSPLVDIEGSIRDFDRQISLSFLLILCALILFSYLVSRRISRPLELIRGGAERLAEGDFSTVLPETGAWEIRNLAASFNHMARDLQATIKRLSERSNDMNMLLSSMKEVVIAIDRKQRVLWINDVAALTFKLDPQKSIGEYLFNHLREPDIITFVRNSMKDSAYAEEKISFVSIPEHQFIISSAPVINAEQRPVGLILVIRDITRLENLEQVRKEFVSNVSHELKTPITTIQGYAEALQDRDLKDEAMRQDFVAIILKTARRMNSIVNDLIDLARLDRNENSELELQDVPVADFLTMAVTDLQPLADEKHITIQIQVQNGLMARINSDLMRQALENILVNAIKYSNEGTKVSLSASEGSDNELVLSVEDEGIGIPREALPRIFERFYRVDKARSRKEGGTGLGLSICKHIVIAHRGRITVDSTLGKGSCFRITLPQ